MGPSPSTLVLLEFGSSHPLLVGHFGHWWRLVTANFLHGGLAHLAFNGLALWVIGKAVEQTFGRARMLVVFVATGVAGHAASYAWRVLRDEMVGSVGASAAVFGLLGCVVVYARRHNTSTTAAMRAQFIPWLVFALIMGFAMPQIDHAAHLGGLAAGALFGWFLADKRSARRAPGGVWLAAALVCWASRWRRSSCRSPPRCPLRGHDVPSAVTMNAFRGFYGVVDLVPGDTEDRARALAAALLKGKAFAIQVRMKRSTTRELLTVSRLLRRMTREHDAMLVVNDRVDVALAVGADAVHLGQDDLPIASARRLAHAAEQRLVIGLSTHNPEQARQAARAGADYVAFGPIFETSTKDNPDPVQGLKALEEVVRMAQAVPVVAIGGIDLDTVPDVIAAGARGACLISAVNDSDDVAGRASAVSRAYRDA